MAWRSLLMPPTQLQSLRQDLPRFNKSRVLHLRAFEGGETTFEFEITALIKPQGVKMNWDYFCPVVPHDVFEATL